MSRKELLFFALGTFPSEKRGAGAGFVAPGETGSAGHVFPSNSKMPDFHQPPQMDCKPGSFLE